MLISPSKGRERKGESKSMGGREKESERERVLSFAPSDVLIFAAKGKKLLAKKQNGVSVSVDGCTLVLLKEEVREEKEKEL